MASTSRRIDASADVADPGQALPGTLFCRRRRMTQTENRRAGSIPRSHRDVLVLLSEKSLTLISDVMMPPRSCAPSGTSHARSEGAILKSGVGTARSPLLALLFAKTASPSTASMVSHSKTQLSSHPTSSKMRFVVLNEQQPSSTDHSAREPRRGSSTRTIEFSAALPCQDGQSPPHSYPQKPTDPFPPPLPPPPPRCRCARNVQSTSFDHRRRLVRRLRRPPHPALLHRVHRRPRLSTRPRLALAPDHPPRAVERAFLLRRGRVGIDRAGPFGRVRRGQRRKGPRGMFLLSSLGLLPGRGGGGLFLRSGETRDSWTEDAGEAAADQASLPPSFSLLSSSRSNSLSPAPSSTTPSSQLAPSSPPLPQTTASPAPPSSSSSSTPLHDPSSLPSPTSPSPKPPQRTVPSRPSPTRVDPRNPHPTRASTAASSPIWTVSSSSPCVGRMTWARCMGG